MNPNGKPRTRKKKQLENDLDRLVKNLQETEDFSIHIVVYDSKSITKKVLKALSTRLSRPLRKIEFKKIRKPAEPVLEEIALTAPEEIIFLSDLEKTIISTKGEINTNILSSWNARLFDLRKLNRVVVFILPLQIANVFRENAPDFWEWRSNLYLLQEQDDDPYRTSFFLCDHFADSDWCPRYDQKQELLKLYKAILVEYQDGKSEDCLFLEYNVLGKIAILLFKIGEYHRALTHLNQQMEIAMNLGDEKLFPEILNNIGIINEVQGNYRFALENLQRAWDLGVNMLRGNNHPAKSIILSNIGDVECTLANLTPAFIKCRKALRMAESKLGMRHPGLVPLLLKFSRVYRKQNKWEEALDHYRRGLQIVERKLDIEHPYVAVILQNIGLTYHGQKKYDMARRYVYRTLEMTERALGSEHPYLGLLLNNIGLTHFHCDHIDWALKYYFWALDIRTRTVGPEDVAIGVIHENLAKLYISQGKSKEAQQSLNKAREIFKSKLPSDHPKVKDLEEYIGHLKETMASE
jgi:tetratricopeptide (TPR) repeat protein